MAVCGYVDSHFSVNSDDQNICKKQHFMVLLVIEKILCTHKHEKEKSKT